MAKNKEISLGHEARLKIKAGVDRACNAVRPTLGPIGMTALIEWAGLDPIEADDGVTILKHLQFKDHYEDLGLKMLRKSALRTSVEGGDGTATTTVLTQALAHEAFKEIAVDDSKIREVRERLQAGFVATLAELSKLKRDVKEEDIEKIATISSLDPEVAKLIAEVIKEVGVNGVITVEKGSTIGYTKEVVKGARFDRGAISGYFVNDPENGRVVLEDPYIVLVDRKISMGVQIETIMNSIAKTGHKSVLFIADDIDGIALASLIQASKSVAVMGPDGKPKQGTFDICAVRNPFTASPSRDFLQDMAVLTGGTVISEEAGMRLDQATVEMCGRADKIIITKDDTTIIGGHSTEKLSERVNEIKNQIANTVSEYTKGQLTDRLAQLTGGIGVIRVGAYTDMDFNAKKLKFVNAINATQSALQEGILPGGGSALARVKIEDPMFRRALSAPMRQMTTNAGMEWAEVYGLFKDLNSPSENLNYGIDFKAKKSVDMFEAGIIDPFRVTRLALESAVAITTSLISYGTVITDLDEKTEPEQRA